MTGRTSADADRYWVLGGRWVDELQHLPWPRVYGPFESYQAAQASAADLNAAGDPRIRYLIVADVPEEAA